MRTAFVTGATGAVGINLLHELVETREFERIYCLVRRRATQSGQSRLEDHARAHGFELSPAVVAVHGDVRQPRLGLCGDDDARLVREVTHVFHAAADVRFNQALAAIRRVNVDGTRAVLDLCTRARAANPAFCHLVYIGTAYVAEQRARVAQEQALAPREVFRNSYEQSKFEAEQLVRARRDAVPSIIFRPSIIWSLDGDGRMPAKSAVYPALKMYMRWPLPAIPVHRTTLDIVPADFVARAIARLGMQPEHVGRCFHLAAGAEGDLPLRRFYGLLDEALREVGLHKRIRKLPPWAWKLYFPLLRLTFLRKMRSGAAWGAYFPYVQTRNPRFEVEGARAALARHAIEVPRSEAVVERSLVRILEGILATMPRLLDPQASTAAAPAASAELRGA
ncbi:MAG TPA: SDR family oxidoreductase [Kofleriaceae bacterium]|nr:SDR family oxidoreductase [Kofleriaceae bacterium]